MRWIYRIFPLVLAVGLPLFLTVRGACWWSGDDPQILKHAVTHSVGNFFFSPAAWQELTASNWTPLLNVSFLLDWVLGGFSPRVFYIHQAISLALLMVAVWGMGRRYFGTVPLVVGILWVAGSLPFVEASDRLMVRHYAEGAFWSVASLWMYSKFVECGGARSSTGWLALSFLFYVLACFSKEVFVPLPVVFLILSGNRFSWKPLIPFGIWIGVYALWRSWMLGSFGGYGHKVLLNDLGALLAKITELSGWRTYGIWLVPVGGVVWSWVEGNIRRRFFILLVSAGVFAPLLAVAHQPSIRHMWVPVLVGGFLSGCLVHRVERIHRILAVGIAAWSIGVLMTCNVWGWKESQKDFFERAEVEGRFVLEEKECSGWIRNPVEAPWFYEGLGWFRMELFHLDPGPRPFWDPIALRDSPKEDVWEYDPRKRRMRRVGSAGSEWKGYESKVRWKAPFHVFVRYTEPVIQWRFGPYMEGGYAFLFEGPYRVCYPVASQGRAPVRFTTAKRFRVRYESPEGWVTYSPVLALGVEGGKGEVRWRR